MFELGGNVPSFAMHGGGDSGGMAGLISNVLGFIERLVTLSPGQMFGELMPGIANLENIHPLFVHFPIALLSLFFIVDNTALVAKRSSWRKMATPFLYSGTLFTLMTVVAGFLAAASIPHADDVHDIMEHHEHLAISVSLLALALSVWRYMAREMFEGPANVLHALLSSILMVLLILTADLGGLMVYGHGVAVQPVMATQREAAAAHQHDAGRGRDYVEDARDQQPVSEQAVEPPIEQSDVKSPERLEMHVHRDGSQHVHKH